MTTDNDRLRELAAATDQPVASPEEIKRALHSVLVFRVGARVFGTNARNVYEVVVSGSITQVPTARAFVLGITLVRGRVVPVISLGELLGVQTGDEAAATLPRLLMVRDGALEIAVLADATLGLFDLDITDLGSATGPRPDCVAGELEFRDNLLLLLDGPALIRAVVGEIGVQ